MNKKLIIIAVLLLAGCGTLREQEVEWTGCSPVAIRYDPQPVEIYDPGLELGIRADRVLVVRRRKE